MRRKTNKNWLKFFVLTFCAADAAGIYIAHQKLSKPVNGSLEGELIAYTDGKAHLTPASAGTPQAVAPSPALALEVRPELRFTPASTAPSAPIQAVPEFRPSAPVQQPHMARADLPKPAFGIKDGKRASMQQPHATYAPVFPVTTKGQNLQASASTVETGVHTHIRQTAESALHRNAVRHRSASFAATFADLTVSDDAIDPSITGITPQDADQDRTQRVATAPAAMDMVESPSPVVDQPAAALGSELPAAASELAG